jgi:hypothetical protein
MNFQSNQGYSLKFFSTGLPSDTMDPQGKEIITLFPEYVIPYVFNQIDEGFVIIKETPYTYTPMNLGCFKIPLKT